MRFCFLLCLLVFSFEFSFAQQFLDKNGNPVAYRVGAAYYRTVEKQGELFIVKDFYCTNDQLEMEAPCESIKDGLKKHGKVTTYYENGKIAKESNYSHGDLQGIEKSYYEDGDPKDEISHTEKGRKYLQVWSAAGEPLLTDGSGVVVEFHEAEQTTSRTEYKNYDLYKSFSIRSVQRDTIYGFVEKQAEYNGGFPAMARFVGQTLRYPAYSRRMKIQGTVFVAFIVDKKGNITDAEVLKGISSDCDEEALRCVKEMSGNWTAAIVEDKYVKSKFVLPIKFKLAR